MRSRSPTRSRRTALGIFSIPGAPTDEGGCVGRDALFRERRRCAADGQGRAQVDGPPPRSARPGRRSDPREGQGHRHRRPCRPVDQRGADASRPKRCRSCARASSNSTRISGSIPKGHSGKALRHAVASLPRDLLVNLDYEAVRELVMMAMSLADRPRPALLQVRSILERPFVQLRLAAARGADDRAAQGDRADARGRGRRAKSPAGRSSLATATSRSSATPNISNEDAPLPDAEALDAALVEMVRGWAPAVEAELIAAAGGAARDPPRR